MKISNRFFIVTSRKLDEVSCSLHMLFLDFFFPWNDLLILFVCTSFFFFANNKRKEITFKKSVWSNCLFYIEFSNFWENRNDIIFIPKVCLKFVFHLLTFIFYVMAAPLIAMLNEENLLAEVQYVFFSWFVWNWTFINYHKLTVSILPLSLSLSLSLSLPREFQILDKGIWFSWELKLYGIC